MKNMTIREITIACKGDFYGDDALLDREVSSVVIDSRLVEKDSLFVAIKGARVDGHSFIPGAINDGALLAISETKPASPDYPGTPDTPDTSDIPDTPDTPGTSDILGTLGTLGIPDTPYTPDIPDTPNIPYILVPSSEQALIDLAEHYRSSLDVKVVGITGSVGKTSTKEMMASVLSQKYSVQKTPGNFNNEIGLPLSIFSIREEHQIAVLEMGISKFGDMNILSQMAKPDICVLTNIGTAHIEYLKTRDGILKEKSHIFDYMNPHGKIFLNGDDDKLITVPPYKGIVPAYYGMNPDFPFYATDIIDKGLKGTTATYHTPTSTFTAHIQVPGTFMVYNALAATAVAYSLDMADEEIIKGIEALTPIAGRSHIIETEKYTIIDDCYNAGPATMKSALGLLEQATTRKVAILGDMFELGAEEENIHYDVGIFAGDRNLDLIICIGPLAKNIYQGCQSRGFENSLYFPTKNDFFENIYKLLNSNDTILLKASNGMAFSEIVAIIKDM
jgi:UDP-N-acetylmuramoyl-tripeptide--D-alanyl-D-alanine ligase